MKLAFLFILVLLPAVGGAESVDAKAEKVRRLKEYLAKEKPRFEKRKKLQSDTLEELDRLNAEQNAIRQRVEAIALNHGELTMALENLAVEQDKQRRREAAEKQRLVALMKMAHRVKRDGLLRFLIQGSDLTDLSGRARVLFRTLKSHSVLAKGAEERTLRLEESERKIEAARNEAKVLWEELATQEQLLHDLLQRKQELLSRISQQQQYYEAALDDYERASREMKRLFSKLEAQRDGAGSGQARQGTLEIPVAHGRIVKQFGRQVHPRFRTVTYHNGVEIAAPHNTPVMAVLPGVVEFEGWVKGLGNVVIIHHGGGFYSLSAHLYMATARQGQKVAQGDTIGMVGDTGNSDKPSLYFEIRENGKPVDPVLYFSTKAMKNFT